MKMITKFEDFINESENINERIFGEPNFDIMPGVQNMLDYFGINQVKDIARTKNWAKIMKMVKSQIGKYMGYKVEKGGYLEVVGDKGWVKLLFPENDGPQFENGGKLYK